MAKMINFTLYVFYYSFFRSKKGFCLFGGTKPFPFYSLLFVKSSLTEDAQVTMLLTLGAFR